MRHQIQFSLIERRRNKMPQFFVYSPDLNFHIVEIDQETIGKCLNCCFGDISDFYVTQNGSSVDVEASPSPEAIYRVEPRLPGGKGGFGSMLRAIGAQIDKTRSREACRDLSGRRMRDVNNEKKLREWIAKKADREKVKEDQRKARLERLRAEPKHKFDDSEYMEQKACIADNLEDALQAGLQRASSSAPDTSQDRAPKMNTKCTSDRMKKAAEWLGLDVDDLGDIDSDITSSEDETDINSSRVAEFGSFCDDRSIMSDVAQLSEAPDDSGCLETSQQPDSSTDEPLAKKQKMNQDEIDANGGMRDLEDESGSNKKSTDDDVSSTQEPHKDINLNDIDSIEDLEALGLDSLKADLMRRGLKCGGTLQERAARLFSIKGLKDDEIPSSLIAKPSKGKGKGKNSS